MGASTAPVSLVVFSDFQCPYCKRAAEWVKAEAAKFDAKELRVVYRFFPLSFHPWAKPAAEAAACVAAQSPANFWMFHDAVFANQAAINPGNVQEKLLEFAKSIPGVDVAGFTKCVESGRTAETVRKDQTLGASVQVRGTPTVFINGKPLPGLRSPEQLHAAIEEAAASAKPMRTAMVR
jgi:protein-disulfide isomerase